MQVERSTQGSSRSEMDLEAPSSGANESKQLHTQVHTLTSRAERFADTAFVMPAVLVVLALSIFPLIISLYLSFSNLRFVRGGFEVSFVGLAKYRKLLFGSEQSHFLGVIADPGPVSWLIFGLVVAALVLFLSRYIQSPGFSPGGLFWRSLFVIGMAGLAWLLVHTLSPDGRPGTLVVTLIYVFVGIAVQYVLG
ncbi:MAG: hypothetical protein R3264_15185, partial [Anaerolineae bacterium]|nr:hypothetical protein [Anaerolineae bacterium]